MKPFRKCVKRRILLLRENIRQEDILLSVLPRHIANDVRNDRATEGQSETMFHKIYIRKHNIIRYISCSTWKFFLTEQV